MKILEQVLNKINPIRKNQKDFLLTIIPAFIASAGKKTMRNLSRYAGIVEQTIARQMAKKIDFLRLNTELIKDNKADSDLVIAAQDTSFASKSGKSTFGLGWFWNGCAGKAEKGLELCAIAVITIGQEKNEALTLSARQTPSKGLKKADAKKQDPREKNRIDFALDHIKDCVASFIKLGIKYIAVDSFYAKEKYITGVVQQGFHVITKLRKDSRFLETYDGPQKARGRKRKTTNTKITKKHFSLPQSVEIKNEKIELSECVAYSVAFGRKIKIVSVKKTIGKKEAEVFLCSTDLELDAFKIYQFYTARFQIEFLFRDAKGFTGLADCQSRDSRRINYHLNVSFVALNLSRLQDAEFQKSKQISQPFSMANIARKYHVESVINHIFCMLDFDLTLIKSHPNFQKALAFGNIMH